MNDVDKQVLKGLKPAERIKALLRAAGFGDFRVFAKAKGLYVAEVSMCVNNKRPYYEIRDALAETTGLPRAEIDQIIDQAA